MQNLAEPLDIPYISNPFPRFQVNARGLIIAIDGPAASGKSTTARRVAAALGYIHIDSGAMYRAFTLKVLRAGIRPDDRGAIERLLEGLRIELQQDGEGSRVLLDGVDVSQEIRAPEVTDAVSAVSSLRAVRAVMVKEQKRMGRGGGVVMDGRDIGTVVFPDADLKVFMVAGIDARAHRRQEEFRARGIDRPLEVLQKEIAARDALDSGRQESPLRRASDAFDVDTSALSIDQQVAFVIGKAKEILKTHVS